MKTLCIDTSSFVASVSIIEEGKVIGESTINFIRNHSITLMPLIENLLKVLNLNINDINRMAVTTGPGSFTGQRIGASCAIALAKATGSKIVPINTLDLLKENHREFDGLVVPIIDARRGEVYYSIYEKGKRLVDYNILPFDEVLEICKCYDKKVIFTGDGIFVHIDKITETNFFIASKNNNYQRASSMAEILEEYEEVDYMDLKLFYIKKTEAEREYNQKHFKILEFNESLLDNVFEVEKDAFFEPWSKKMFEEELNNKFARYFVGVIDDVVVGYIGSWYVLNEGQITNIAVKKDYRGQGFGKKLVQKVIDYYNDLECIGVTLEVRQSNDNAIALYKSFGFEIEGMRKNYYNNGEDAHIMWLHLEQEF
ncbi:MAG: tRNA (adenosine(37)-N6)-threonylcarbamoyltransferase complex dimerization subunit type 1 TsaB [Lachnospirales bacterium]